MVKGTVSRVNVQLVHRCVGIGARLPQVHKDECQGMGVDLDRIGETILSFCLSRRMVDHR